MEQIKKAIITEYWLKKLSGELPKISLPFITNRKTENTLKPNAQSVQCDIPQSLTEKLLKSSKNSDIALFILFLSGINVVLSRYSGVDNVLVGTFPVETDEDGKSIIFCRTHIPQHLSIKETITQTKDEVLEAMQFRDFSLDEILKALKIRNNTDALDIFNVAFLYGSFRLKDSLIDRFDLVFILNKQKNQLVTKIGDFLFCNLEILKNLSQNVIVTLDCMLKNTSLKISMLDILNPQEREQILYKFNKVKTESLRDKTIHQLFEEQVARTPDQMAVVGPSGGVKQLGTEMLNNALSPHFVQISYFELNEKTNRLASFLQEQGVRPDIIVGIKMERSIELSIGILGILKSGSAYLPIDPDYPAERKEFIIKDSNAAILLTLENQEITTSRLKGPGISSRVVMQSVSTLAYIIYTSGSTGRPKGVVIEHGSVVNVLTALFKQYPFLPADTYLLKTSYTFDVSVTELFGWFLGGGRLVVLEEGREKDPKKIAKEIECYSISHINFVPSMFSAFLDMLDIDRSYQLSSLKYIFLAGEALLTSIVQRFKHSSAFGSGIVLENIYGPTENTIYSSWYSLSRWENSVNIPIGKPLPNVKLYILNKYSQLHPIGVAGELGISGPGLSRGYLNRPDLTREKFISHSVLKKARMYRSGDLARWLPDGNIEFLGRIDHQVKVRGNRVELEEIENLLVKQEEIKAAVVSLKDEHLFAYIVSKTELKVSQLRENLAKKLPAYMVPSYFVKVEEIPLTSNGKVDRKALESIGIGTVLPMGVEFIAPRDHIEKTIANFWKELLNLKEVGIDDNFFDLGGTSLDIYKLNRKYKEVFDEDEVVLKMFRYPTIRAFSQYLNKKEAKGDDFHKFKNRKVPVDRARNSRTYQKEKRKGSKYGKNH